MSDEAQRRKFLFEALDLISNTTVLGVLFGVASSLYCLCAQLLYLQLRDPDKQKQAKFTLGYISLLLFCATGYLAGCTRHKEIAYIHHSDILGGPLIYEASPRDHLIVIGIFDISMEVLTLGIQVGHNSCVSMPLIDTA